MHSVLKNYKNGKYNSEPFPYIVIDNALPLDYYNQLDKTFPKFQEIIKNQKYIQNFAYRKNASQSLLENNIPEIWKNFIRFHTSFEFVQEVYKVFMDDIIKFYPPMKNNLLQNDHCGVRFIKKNDFNLDAQFVINTPVEKKSSVIEPHLDNPIEFFAGLLYMRNNNDDSTGGNLCTYNFKKNPIFYGKSRVKNENVTLIEEIEYKPNRLVLFINTLQSLHGVSEKDISNHYRKYINIIGEFNFELFNFRKFLEK